MPAVEFVIPGPPKGKGRPRFCSWGGHAHVHTPDDTIVYENLVRVMYAEQVGSTRLEPPIHAEITGFFPIPKSWSRRKAASAEAGELEHISKIDCDNLAKIVLDALNGIAYADDAQVSRLSVSKIYSSEPRVVVRLSSEEQSSGAE